jgi:uncharacterized DUF497 family protein
VRYNCYTIKIVRFDWDDLKSETVKAKRGLSFDELLPLFKTDYLLEGNKFYEDQFLAIGFLGTEMITVVFESREDEEGEFVWIITYWRSTKSERMRYAKEKK